MRYNESDWVIPPKEPRPPNPEGVNTTTDTRSTLPEIPDWVKYTAVALAAGIFGYVLGDKDDDKQIVVLGRDIRLEDLE